MMQGKSFILELQRGARLVADGATGTNLQQRGLPAGVAPDEWVIDNPNAVLQLHSDFVAAGSNIILTNTFGATSLRLRGSKFEGQAVELNQQAVALARQAAEPYGVFVGGSLGPVGGLLKPYGALEVDEVRQTYAEQAAALTTGGVDLLVIETQFSLEEAQAAVEGARSTSHLPLVISFSYDKGVRTMMGVKPSQVMEIFSGMGVAAVGANCGKSLEFMEKVVLEMATAQAGFPIWAKPNAGMPIPGTTPAQYDTTPEQMAQAAVRLVQAGAQVVGGCCGSTPAHIASIAAAILTMD
jgi:5-methyltetrahydrofolate--homocysteine methyltransferase